MVPAMEMTWAGWVDLYPDTRVPADVPTQGQAFANYSYPYGGYERLDNEEIFFPVPPLDRRRPLKERVLGIFSSFGTMGPPGGSPALAFPYEALDAEGAVAAVEAIVDDRLVTVFWDRARQGAVAYYLRVDGQSLSFIVTDGSIMDEETGSLWNLGGKAIDGPLVGARLEQIKTSYVAFWFAWAAFHPRTSIWG